MIAALLIVCGALILGISILRPRLTATTDQLLRLRSWFTNPAAHQEWLIQPTQRCSPDAPMVMPTAGYIGFGWDDSFRPGHRHSGYDIFSPDGAVNVTPVVAAYDGYLTREPGWRSAVIIRHPDFPAVVPGEQIWTFYTHMASADGAESFIAPQFPPGTREVFVPAGTVLGYQGNWSGSAGNPTGIHLHFSIVKSTPGGGYANETDIENTFDPGPFLGVTRNNGGVLVCASAKKGILLGTPEYHAGYSGVLKNALDYMGFSEFEGKMIGLLAVSGGHMGATNALNGLRAIGRALHAWVVPYEVSIRQAWRQFDSQGVIKDMELAERVKELGRQVARFAYLHSAEQAMAFLQAWEEAPVNPGGE